MIYLVTVPLAALVLGAALELIPRFILWCAERPAPLPQVTAGGTFDWCRFGVALCVSAIAALVWHVGLVATALLVGALAVLVFIVGVVLLGRNVSRWDVRDGDGPRLFGDWRPRAGTWTQHRGSGPTEGRSRG